MFLLTFFIGFYGIGIYLLGLLSTEPLNLLIFTIIYLTITLIVFKSKTRSLKKIIKIKPSLIYPSVPSLLLITLGLVNLIGALGPELAFDALWYHLTLPKIYLENGAISYIPGGLFYYSAMPQLGEMYYLVALAFGHENIAKVIHFAFGILTCTAIYKIAQKNFKQPIPIIVVLLFYSNLVVSWESITAYIDLIRAFFEMMGFWAYLLWSKTRERKWLLSVGLILGFASATKVLALLSLLIILGLLTYDFFQEKKYIRQNIFNNIAILIFSTLIIPLPWFVSSFIATGSPVYPFFTSAYPISPHTQITNPLVFLKDIGILFTKAADPLSPVYLSLFPLVIHLYKKFTNTGKIFAIYSLLGIIVWYLTPRTGGGRFILPYLPVVSLLIGEVLTVLKKEKYTVLYKFGIGFIIVSSIITLSIRSYANGKYVPVILGQESKNHFLTEHLNFSFGDFYDTDGFFNKAITDKDKVLLIGFHNLYYVNFPFIHESYLKGGDTFNYIAVQGGELPKEYNDWHMIYDNQITRVKLYKKGKFVVIRDNNF